MHADIAVFDVLSHARMHLPFNEGYLRILRCAFPERSIAFSAAEDHIRALSQRFTAADRIAFHAIAPMVIPFGLSRHNPIGGRLAARRCVATMGRALASATPDLVCVLGVDANLFAVLGGGWTRLSAAPLHMVLHSQLGDAMLWRSRNPFIRAGDFVAQLGRVLPPHLRIVALELGVREAITEVSPSLAGSVDTLEHPILPSEWIAEARPHEGLRLAFLGHSSRTKGFESFTRLALDCAAPGRAFDAIGILAPGADRLDMSGLARRPAKGGLSRAEYLAALQDIDMVCLPLTGRAYDFLASGTVSDAIAALKPLLAFRTRTLAAIVSRYGPIGYLAEDYDDMRRFVTDIEERFAVGRQSWTDNLATIRAARSPAALADTYPRPDAPNRILQAI
jgi:hypothetical protein